MRLGFAASANGAFPRVMIVDFDTGRVWTGRGWGEAVRGAALFLSADDALPEYDRVVTTHYGPNPVQVYVGTVTVEVRGRPVEREALVAYLSRAISLTQHTAEIGTGPADGSHVRVLVSWRSLRGGERKR